MTHRLGFAALLVMLFLRGVALTHAQDYTPPLVVFVVDEALNIPSPDDTTPAGLSELAALFQLAGANVQTVTLDAPLPADTHTIVLVGARSRISTEFLARMWVELAKGKNLLLALDPAGDAGASTDDSNSGISRILTYDFGVGLLNGFMIEPWFSPDSVKDPERSFSLVFPESDNNLVLKPLMVYQIPVQVWGARPLDVEPFGIDSIAAPLLYAAPRYAESDPAAFRPTDPAPLQVNIGTDVQGLMTAGAMAENKVTGGRVVLLADSDMFRNGFGLRLDPDTERPLHPGNYVLAQRLAAWLLELPPDDMPPLPGGFTWIKLDGSGADWTSDIPVLSDAADDVENAALDIDSARVFENDDFMYIYLHTTAPPPINTRIDLEFDFNADGTADTTLTSLEDRTFMQGVFGDEILIPDAGRSSADGIELRLPARATGIEVELTRLCLTTLDAPAVFDCLDAPVSIPVVDQADPSPQRFPVGLAVYVPDDNTPVYSLPTFDSPWVTTLKAGAIIAAVGRSADGAWVEVQTARFAGWVDVSAVKPNGDVLLLPVVE